MNAQFDIETADSYSPDAAYLLIYRTPEDDYELRRDNVWRVSAYGSEDELLADLLANKEECFPALRMRVSLSAEIQE